MDQVFTPETITAILGALGSFVALAVTWVSIRAAAYFKVQRTAVWVEYEKKLSDFLNEAIERAALNAVAKNVRGDEALRQVTGHIQASMPETLDKLKTTAHSKAVNGLIVGAIARAQKITQH